MKIAGLCLAGASIVLVTLATAAAPKDGKRSGVFAPLEKGSKVALKEVGGRYEITVMIPALTEGYTVAEIGTDYVVLVDPSGVTETRLPLFSVKAVTVLKPPKK